MQRERSPGFIQGGEMSGESVTEDEVLRKDEHEFKHVYNEQKAPKRFRLHVVLAKVLMLVMICLISASLCGLSIHIMVLMFRWAKEARRFRNLSDINVAIINYYQEQFYLFYLMIRNWNCCPDGKMTVVLSQYLAS